MSNFPNSQDSFPTDVAHVTKVKASDMNAVQDAVVAVESTLLNAPNPNPLDYVSKSRPDTITGVKSGPFRDWGGGLWNVHSASNPSFSTIGTTDETAAWNAAVVAANAAGGGWVAGLPGYNYKLKRRVFGQQALGGINLLPLVSLWGYGVNLEMGDNAAHIVNPSPLTATVATVTSNITVGMTNFTVDSSAGFTVGDEVFCRLGQNPYDANESSNWLFAKILTIPDSTHLTLDRPTTLAVTVASVGAVNKQITKLSSSPANFVIAGFTFTQGGGGNVEEAINLAYCRNVDFRDLKAIDPGAGLVAAQFCENLRGGNHWVPHSLKQGGQASKGRMYVFAECKNVEFDVIRAENFEGPLAFVESYSEKVVLRNLRVINNFPGRTAGSAIFFCAQGSELKVASMVLEGDGSTASMVDYGGTTGNAFTVEDLTVNMSPQIVNGPAFSDLVPGSYLRIKGAPAAIAGDYREIKTYSRVIPLTPNMSNAISNLPSGLVRRLRVYANSTTGISNIFWLGVSNGGDIAPALVAGQLTDVMQAAGIASWGSNYPSPSSGLGSHGLAAYTGAGVVAGTYLVVQVEYFAPPTGDDLSLGYNEDLSSAAVLGYVMLTKGQVTKRIALAYSATIATDASLGNEFDITANNGTAFTISNPTNLLDGQQITYTIRNTSGGALGVITWGTTFKLPAWTSPATGFSRSITYKYDGTNLVMLHRSDADVPN